MNDVVRPERAHSRGGKGDSGRKVTGAVIWQTRKINIGRRALSERIADLK